MSCECYCCVTLPHNTVGVIVVFPGHTRLLFFYITFKNPKHSSLSVYKFINISLLDLFYVRIARDTHLDVSKTKLQYTMLVEDYIHKQTSYINIWPAVNQTFSYI